MTAKLLGVVNKFEIFGLQLAAYAAGQSQLDVDLTYPLVWIGIATTITGAVFASCQSDMKRLLAYSSMGQFGRGHGSSHWRQTHGGQSRPLSGGHQNYSAHQDTTD